VAPGFPFSNINEDIDCIYEIRPSSPGACRLRILFKLFWVGQEDSYVGCAGGFLEIDGRRYCDCIIGLIVISSFEDFGNGRQKVLRYKKDANVRNSGGFLLEVFQEECTGWSPWSRHGDNNETNTLDQQPYNIPYYYNVSFRGSNESLSANMGDYFNISIHTQKHQNCSTPYTSSRPTGVTNPSTRDHGTYINNQTNKEEQDAYMYSVPCKISNTVAKSNMYSINGRNERLYSYNNNNSVAHESNESTTGTSKNEEIRQEVPQENKSTLNIDRNTNNHNEDHVSNIPHEDNNTMNNSDKQNCKFNIFNKNNSADKRNVSSATDTGSYFCSDMNKQELSYISRSNKNSSHAVEKGTHGDNTRHCFETGSAIDNSNVSAVSNVRNFDLVSLPSELISKSDCQSYRNNYIHAAIDQNNCTLINCSQTEMASSLLHNVTNRYRRNLALPQFRTDAVIDRLLSFEGSTCRLWGFAQWLLQVKQYFWKYIPQLLCPIQSLLPGPRCQVFNQATGWFQSPGYPRSYPKNLNTCYR
jgi:hypothetical protein